MALFGSKKKSTTLQKVRPTVVRTQNVANELIKIARTYETKVETLDFNILDIETFTRLNDGTKETDWDTISEDELYELDEEKALLNPEFQIKQTYEVEIFSKSHEHETLFKEFNYAIGANASKCKVYISIKEGSQFDYYSKFENDLLTIINKSKVRAGILIHIFDEMLEEVVSKISAKVRIQEHVSYSKNETILVAESYEPTPTTNDKLILHYDKEENYSENDKIDYAARGFIKSVHEGELLIEYTKPKMGKPGRNCRGEFIAPKEPVVGNEPTFTVDESIDVKEDDDAIKYFAKENGYITLDNGKYLIKSEMDIKEVSFKSTGSIESGIDSDVSISVKEKDAVKDAVGTGMEVEVSEINVEGNVGSNAKIRALKATIGGQTHKTAVVQADELNINVNKGTAIGKKIHITRLEHGEVNGENVEISQALGGHIKGRDINIEVCGSYVKATASHLIEIKKLHGSENIFTIDPLLHEDTKTDLDKNQEIIKKIENEIKEAKKDIEKYTKIVTDNLPAFNEVKKRLLHYKQNNIKLPNSFVRQYKEFQKTAQHLEDLKKSEIQKQDELDLQNKKTSSFQDSIFDARIINHERWIGYNELIFKMVDPPLEITYTPQEGSAGKVFGLVENDDGRYEVRVIE